MFIEKGEDLKEYKVWEDFNQYISKILDNQTYKTVKLFLPSERGLVTRGIVVYGSEKDG